MNENDNNSLNVYNKKFAIMEFNLTDTSSHLCKLCPNIIYYFKNTDHSALFLVILLVFTIILILILFKSYLKALIIGHQYIVDINGLDFDQIFLSKSKKRAEYITNVISSKIAKDKTIKQTWIFMANLNYFLFILIDYLTEIEIFFEKFNIYFLFCFLFLIDVFCKKFLYHILKIIQ